MSYVLTGSRYIGTGALPVPVLGYDAVDTSTGNFYVSNSSATSWVQVGNVNSPNLGMLPLTGGTMTGNVAGATGWAPNDSPNFTNTAKLNGITLATSNDLSTTSTTILNSIAPKITQAVASTAAAITVKSNVAMASGLLSFTTATPQTIPLPVYSDGTTANESDCKWMVGLTSSSGTPATWADSWPCGRSDGNGDTSLIMTANPTTTRTFAIYLQDKGGVIYPATVSYMIIGVRS
jgi:hypothetical protein